VNVERSGLAQRGGRPRRAAGLAVAASLSVAACTPEPAVGIPLPFSRGGAGTYTGLAQQIFVPRCASGSCHGGSPPPAFPQLDAEAGWAAMVNVQSQQDVMMLVAPGSPEQSWLVIRLRGEGGRPYMPLGDAQLTEEEIAAVEGWITNGALND
jgi:mono/diheme cytochrome c family protein